MDPRIIKMINRIVIPDSNARNPSNSKAMATDCLVYPIETTITKYGMEIRRESHGRGWLPQKRKREKQNMRAQTQFTKTRPPNWFAPIQFRKS